MTKQENVTVLSVLCGSATNLQLLFLNSDGQACETVNHGDPGFTRHLRLSGVFSCDFNRKDKIVLELPHFRWAEPGRRVVKRSDCMLRNSVAHTHTHTHTHAHKS